MVEGRSSSGGSVAHLPVVCVVLEKVSGWIVFVAKGRWGVVKGGQVAGGELCCGVDAILAWEAWPAADKLEESSSVVKAVNQAVHQHQVPAQLVKEVVCSVVLEVCLVWHGFCVEWVAADVLVDHEKEVH